MLALSVYGTVLPSGIRCSLPGAIGCPGGTFGPTAFGSTTGEQWFNVSMYDWGFWIYDTTSGANETNSWNVYEGWTVHINATSLPPTASIGGTAYHGLGVELNATGQQLLSLAAPVGRLVTGTFVAPTTAYYHQHIWCTIQCGPGHGSQQAWVLNIVPATILPSATLSASPTSGLAPLTVSFNATIKAGTPPYNTTWSFGDGASAYRTNTNHTFTLGGTYYPTLTVVDSNGYQSSASLTVLVGSVAPLTAVISPTPASGVAPLGVFLSTEAHGGAPPYNYSWSFGDGISSRSANATSHLYTSPGVYAVAVTVSDSLGGMTRGLASVKVLPSAGSFPLAVSATPSNGSAPFQVNLQATPSGGTAPYSDFWVFGDGTTGSGSPVSHMYNLTGSYEATVFVTDSSGKVSSLATNIPVLMGGGGGDNVPTPAASSPLTLFLLTTPPSGGAPLSVNASASILGGTGTHESVSWNFGDGSTGTGQVVSHQFGASGTYNVSVTASDSGSNSGSAATVVVAGGVRVAIALNRSQGDSPFSIVSAASIQGGSGTYRSANWSWGDGTTSVGYLLNHTYADTHVGTMTVRVTVSDSSGGTASASTVLTIYPAPRAILTRVLPGSMSPPVTAAFKLNLTGGSGVFSHLVQWSFGDKSSTQGPMALSHNYTKPGHFLVTVETTDSLGGVAVASTWVNVSGGAPPLSTTEPVWSFTGVADPNQAALVLMGIVAVTGLGLLLRKQRKSKSKGKSPASPSRAPARPSAGAPETAKPPKES